MYLSPAHAAAARANGSLSHGPVSSQGKAASAQNARKHGFLATRILSTEDQQAFAQLRQSFFDEYRPAGPTEEKYVSELADAEWRLARIRDYMASLHQNAISQVPSPSSDTPALTFQSLLESSHGFQLLLRYETQYRRLFDRTLDQLLKLRRARVTDRATISRHTAASLTAALDAMITAPMPSAYTPSAPMPATENPVLRNEPISPTSPSPQQPQIARSAPCPCGSGEKFKRCCGRNAPPLLHSAA